MLIMLARLQSSYLEHDQIICDISGDNAMSILGNNNMVHFERSVRVVITSPKEVFGDNMVLTSPPIDPPRRRQRSIYLNVIT